MRLRRTALRVLLWCLATAASIAVASMALRPVLRTAVPSDSVPVPVAEARGPGDLIPQPPMPTTGAPTTATSPAASPTTTPGTTTSSAPAAKSPTPVKVTTTSVPRVVAGWTVTTGSDGVDTYLRSFRSEGGDAVIRIRVGVVSLVAASPSDGYSVSKSQTEPARLVVQFISVGGNAAYLVDAMWWNDFPYGEVTRIGT